MKAVNRIHDRAPWAVGERPAKALTDRSEGVNASPERPARGPVTLLEVELTRSLAAIPPENGEGGERHVSCLVRLHEKPVGLVDLVPPRQGMSPEDLGREIWRALGSDINEHLERDGLSRARFIPPVGLPPAGTPSCLSADVRLLEEAPAVSVIVATHGRPDRLVACLRALAGLTYRNYEVLVVDNAPRSRAAAAAAADFGNAFGSLRYIREERPGPSWSRNRGLLEAGADIVAFVADDVLVDARSLLALVAGFRAAADVGCVAGLILPLELETPAQILLEEYRGSGRSFVERVFDLDDVRREKPAYPYASGSVPSGGCIAFRRSALDQIGGFSPALGSGNPACGGEDLAALESLLREGCRVVYEPAALGRRRYPREYGDVLRQLYREGVAQGAYLAERMVNDRKLIWEIIGGAEPVAAHLLSPSPRKRWRRGDYLRDLAAAEVKGLLAGPLAYARGRRNARRIEETLGRLSIRSDNSNRWQVLRTRPP